MPPQESEIESKLNKLSRKDEGEKERKMAQVRAALKEVNQRNRDLGRYDLSLNKNTSKIQQVISSLKGSNPSDVPRCSQMFL